MSAPLTVVGAQVPRKDAADKVSGRAEYAVDERLVDDGVANFGIGVARFEIAAGGQAGAHGLEVAGAGIVGEGVKQLGRFWRGLAFDVDFAARIVEGEREAVGEGRGFDAGDRAHLFNEATLELVAARTGVGVHGKIERYSGGCSRGKSDW